MGHEIGHGFDDQGSLYDGDGNMVDWWTDEDRAQFRQRADRLIEQYDGFAPRGLPDKRVNGSLTVGENIGDLGGLQVGLQAYLIRSGWSGAAHSRRTHRCAAAPDELGRLLAPEASRMSWPSSSSPPTRIPRPSSGRTWCAIWTSITQPTALCRKTVYGWIPKTACGSGSGLPLLCVAEHAALPGTADILSARPPKGRPQVILVT